MWSHCNSLHAVDYINSGSLLKHGRRHLTFTNYTSFSICNLKWQTFLWNTNIATSYEMGQVRLCDQDTYLLLCCIEEYRKSKPEEWLSAASTFCGLWVMCLFSKIGRIKTKIHHSFCLVKLCKDAFFFNTLIFNRSRSRTFQSHYHLLYMYIALHVSHWAEYNWWHTSIFRLKVLLGG